MVIFHGYVSLPEGSYNLIGGLEHDFLWLSIQLGMS